MKSEELDKVVKLFLLQHSEEELHERHIAAIQKLCKQNNTGFALTDVPRLVQILEVSQQLIQQGSSHFVEPTCSLIRTLAKPYTKRTSSDELKLGGIITGLLKALARMLQPGMPQQLQECTAELLAEFSSAYNNRPDILDMSQEAAAGAATADLQSARRLYHTHQSLLFQSGIAYEVCIAFSRALSGWRSKDPNLTDSSSHNTRPSSPASKTGSRPTSSSSSSSSSPSSLVAALLAALVNFSYSCLLSEQLLQAGVLALLAQLLQGLLGSEAGQDAKLVTQVVELLWNMLEQAPETAGRVLSNNQQQQHQQQTPHCTPSTEQQQQQQQQLENQQQPVEGEAAPWHCASMPAGAAEIWVRQSCCNSSSSSARPASGVALCQLPSVACDVRRVAGSAGSTVISRAAATAPASVTAAVDSAVGGGLPSSAAACEAAETVADGGAMPASVAAVDGGGASSISDLHLDQTAMELVQVLTALFKQQLQNTSSKLAKEQRNDTLAVLHHLSSIPSCSSAIASSSFLPVALAAATTPELQPSSTHIPAGALTKENADHEMKQLIWGMLGTAAANSNCLAVVAPGLLRVLLLVVDESAGRSCFAVGRWNPEQLLALRRLAWSVLQQVGPLCRADFCSCGGVSALVRHISTCYSSNSSIDWTPRGSSPGGKSIGAIATSTSLQNSFVSGGGGSFSSRSSGSSIEPALRLLQKLVTGDAGVALAFADQGLIPALLQLLQAPVCSDAAAAKQGVQLLLAELCASGGTSCIHKLRQADGVGLLLKECQDVLESDPSLPSLAGLAALDCLWRCCIPSARCRAHLLALDGMDVLLGLLLHGNPYLRPVVLSILADLLADQRSHPFFSEWHAPAPQLLPDTTSASLTHTGSPSSSPNPGHTCQPGSSSVTAAQLLISIWKEQDQAKGLSGPDNLLANPARPLAGSGGRSKWAAGEAGVTGGYGALQPERQQVLQQFAGASSPDLLMDKVYACFAELGFASLAGRLPPGDAAVLVFIEQYVKFRQGEVWQDIREEFEAAGLTPTQEDGVRVLSGIQHSELIASQVQQAQAALLAAVHGEQLVAERAMYEAMLVQASADAKAKVYVKDSSKLTMRERLAAKAQKEEMLKRSVAHSLEAASSTANFSIPAARGVSAGSSGGSSTVPAAQRCVPAERG